MSATHVHCSSIVVVSWPAGVIVNAIKLDSDAAHSNVKGVAQTMTTWQSEMANTSPCHIPVLGDVPPIKIDPRSCDKKYLKEIVGQVLEIYTIELLGSLPTDEA